MTSPHRRALLALTVLLAGCPSNTPADAGDGAPPRDSGPSDAAPDAADAAAPQTIAELPVASMTAAMGLDGPVDVVVDHQGWPHVYARTLHDAAFVQGVLMARDRLPQMELIRRSASGTLAEAFGALSPTLIERDLAMRVVGLRRTAEAMWAQTTPGRARTMLTAYAQGVNFALDEIRSGRRRPATGTELVINEHTANWTEVDTLVVGRYQAFVLSYEGDAEVAITATRDRATDVFDNADPTAAPELARRRGAFWDLYPFAAPSPATVVPDFYATMGMGLRYAPPVQAVALPPRAASDTRNFFDQLREAARLLGDRDRGSNNWVVAASGSSTGHALLANDPHLSLTAPAVWWGSHLVVTDGPDAVDVAGVTFPGIPGVVLGYNRRVAWGGTVSEFDVTDVFRETVTPGAAGAPDTVLFQGRQVPIDVITEQVPDGSGGMVEARIEVVPHHGPIAPTISMGRIQPRTGTTALSVRWTGHQPSAEFDAFVGLAYATSVAEARHALDSFGVGSQNWVIADVDGNAGYTTSSIVPDRAAGARTWSPSNRTGTLPCFVLPGTGEAEWTGTIPRDRLPNATATPAHPWIATANNDQAGLARDGNPVNDPVYLACRWAYGWRAERIQQRLTALPRVSPDDMRAIQNDHVVLAAGRLRPFVQTALAALFDEWATPGTHPELTAVATALRPREAVIRDAAMRLMAWSLDAAAGVDFDASPEAQGNAAAASIFHAFVTAAVHAALADEFTALGGSGGIDPLPALLNLLEHPEALAARDATTMQSVLWDDLGTTGVRETRDAVLVTAFDTALRELERAFMAPEPARWLWGTVHTVRFASIVPGPGAALSIPPMTDATYPNGFPRPGGIDTVDVGNPGYSDYDFRYASGPSMRFTVEMDPAGPHGFNTLPGGEAFNTTSRHHRDLAELWRTNRVFAIPRLEPEVVRDAETRLVFTPMP